VFETGVSGINLFINFGGDQPSPVVAGLRLGKRVMSRGAELGMKDEETTTPKWRTALRALLRARQACDVLQEISNFDSRFSNGWKANDAALGAR
jgi:hypothetical protein